MKRLSDIVLTLILCTPFLLASCTKTKYENEKRPYNAIETFSLPGYTGDSINAVINNGSIIVYWAAETAMPATIKPAIVVSPYATITPASGTEVPFSTETVYTVTAEDGTKQTYRLKPVINHAIPKISLISPNNIHLISSPTVTVSGEYFLSSGNPQDVHVYAQRLSDGFEFDLQIDYSQLTMTNITAALPDNIELLDTGLHKIWVKIGDRVSDEKQVTIRMPDIAFTNLMHLTFAEAGRQLAAGDSMTLKFSDEYNGEVCKWYKKKFTQLVFENYTFEASALTQTDSTIKFKLPATPLDKQPSNVIIYFVDPYYNPTYLSRGLPASSWPIIPVQH